ncbi:hypothetical protein KR009_008914 [Drosophila setifemur]|nr:hypothetical protein KR009_008914 [Drosophila setifemur]
MQITAFWWIFALIASHINVSLAGTEKSVEPVCALQDPPAQCGKFCLTALKPIMDHIADHQQQWNLIDALKLNETQAKLEKIQNQLVVLQETISKMDALKTNSKFQLFGTGYFYIENVLRVNAADAAKTCEGMGGHLAIPEHEEMFNALKAQLAPGRYYWMGLNDKESEGLWVTSTNGRRAPFLKWASGFPLTDRNENCVDIKDGLMYDDKCSDAECFICQKD